MSRVALGSTLGLLGWTSFCVLRAYIRPLFSPLRVIPGPDKPHWLYGHFRQIKADANTGDTKQKWMAQFGHIYRFKAFFNVRLPDFLLALPQ